MGVTSEEGRRMMLDMRTEHEKQSPASMGVFDLSNAEGVTDSERLLMRLCRKSFLSLWAHANLHTAQDMRQGKGSAKEFADVLVVFGDDVIVFSDKHIEFQKDKDLAIAWPRWFKRAISESAKQLHGAMSWLRRFPDRVFLDAACKRPLPLVLPPPDRARYHLVAVTRGSRAACLEYFRGDFGTLRINTEIEGKAHEKTPFNVGVLDRSKHFIHVFDEFSLEVVMGEMDTITDFVSYLNARQDFLTASEAVVVAAGEEQLVALYISNGDGSKHAFLPDGVRTDKPSLVLLDNGLYESLKKRPDYMEKRRQDSRSHAWDALLERLILMGDPKLVHPEIEQANHETEQALRLMASESRFRRHLLTEALAEMLDAAAKQPKQRRARVFTTRQQPDLVYVFLVTPRLETEIDGDYRRHRVAMLHAYCRCAKLRIPHASTFIGLGLDHPAKSYEMSSEDVIVFECAEYTPEQRAEAERIQQEFGILKNGLTVGGGLATELPTAPPAVLERQRVEAADKKKRKAKLARASKRRNRR